MRNSGIHIFGYPATLKAQIDLDVEGAPVSMDLPVEASLDAWAQPAELKMLSLLDIDKLLARIHAVQLRHVPSVAFNTLPNGARQQIPDVYTAVRTEEYEDLKRETAAQQVTIDRLRREAREAAVTLERTALQLRTQ